MKYLVILFGVLSVQLFGQCPPQLIHDELQSPHGYIFLRVEGLNQDRLSEVTAFVDSIAIETGEILQRLFDF